MGIKGCHDFERLNCSEVRFPGRLISRHQVPRHMYALEPITLNHILSSKRYQNITTYPSASRILVAFLSPAMADYSHYGLPTKEWTEFLGAVGPIARTTIGPNQSIKNLQETTNRSREEGSAHFMATSGLSKKIEWSDYEIRTRDGRIIPARIYRAKDRPAGIDSRLPVYLYFHGGGFMFGTLSSEDASCARIVSSVPIIVVNVCYRHTPQFLHPTQVNDAQDAFIWVSEQIGNFGGDPQKLIVGGVSAGAALAATTVLTANRDHYKAKVFGQVLCIPWLSHPDLNSKSTGDRVGSYIQNVDGPILPRIQIEFFSRHLNATNLRDISIFASNAADNELLRMPKTVLLVCGRDPLRDEGLDFAERLQNLG
jgi:acetyl esterase/lipase